MRRMTLWFAAASLSALATAAQAQTAGADQEPDTTVEEVVVTAAPYAVSADALTSNVDVLDRDELDVSPPQGLGDLLSGMPGLRSTYFGPGASRPVVRGLAGPRVLVLTNGVGMIDASTLSPDHQVAVDPAEAQRIEVLRGPSALLYGGSAIGGVVNILDERVPTSPATGVDGRVSAQLSSVDDGRQGSVQLKFGEGPWVVAFDALRRETDDYAVPVAPESRRLAASEGEEPEPADRVENSAVALTTYGAGVSYVAARGFAGVSVKRTETSYGVPGHGHEGEDGEEGEEDHGDTTIDLEQTRFDLRGEADVDLGPFSRARGTLGVADYEHVELEGDEVGTRFTSDGFEGRFELVQRKRGGWSGAVGVQGLQRSLTALGEEAYVPSTDIREVGVFTAQRVDLDAWGFEGGLRFDRRTLESDAGDREFDNVSASVGMFARPVNGAFVGVSLSRNERAPTEAELFAFGEHAATRSFEVGDAGLDSEVAYSVEIAGHYENGPFEADLHLFSARYEGFIDLRATGDENDGVPVFAYRAVDADFRGFEGEASLEMWRSGERELRLETGFDFVRGETDQGPPARIPSWSLTARVVYETPQLESRLEVRRVGDQNRVAEFELPTEGYVLTNLFAAYKPPAVEGLVLFAEARNLFDEEAREHASFLKDLAPLPGRNLRAGLAYRF